MAATGSWPGRDEGRLWPGRIGPKYQAINWNQPATAVAAQINSPTGFVAVTFVKGTKIALADAEVVESISTVPPGTLLARVDGPVEFATQEGAVRVNRYAIEGRTNFWHFHDRMGAFLAHFAQLHPPDHPVMFNAERYDILQNIRDRFTVTFGIKREREPPNAELLFSRAAPLYNANREWLLQLYRRLQLKPGARVLDMGCGGIWTSLAARDAGLEPWGCDLADDGYFASISDWFRYFRADMADLQPLPAKFDLIFMRGVQLLAYARDLDFKGRELSKLRDRILDGLCDTGAIFIEHYSNGSGRWKTPNDFAHTTMADLHEWLGRHFPHVEYSRSCYVSMLASRKPLTDPWRANHPPDVSDDKALAMVWQRLRGQLDPLSYLLLLLKISQAPWRVAQGFPFRHKLRAFILGSSDEAADLERLIRDIQRTIRLVGRGAVVPDDVRGNPFIYVMPDATLPEPLRYRHHKISYAELIGRTNTRDIFSTAQDHDIKRVKQMLDTSAKQPARKDRVANVVLLSEAERKLETPT
jgi:hypothetical protein